MEALDALTGVPVNATSIDGVVVLRPTPSIDDRGFFTRTLDVTWLDDAGVDPHFVQHNQSRSGHAVLRGLHVRAGHGETKLVRCAHGRIVDHVVDTRPWSSTFGRSERFVLDDVDHVHLVLPPFVAHGFQVVSDVADVCYLHSRPYAVGDDVAIAWNDPDLALVWPILPPVISDRDAGAPSLADTDLLALFVRP